ncbi:MAG: CidA/LrgA family protein [Eubacterium sp.]|nr:CidA/LrgA family protein [Eubacterium sp.]
MKYIKQFLIILFVSFLGEILHHLIPLPIPASIYGILLMFLALELHIIPLASVRETGRFLIEIMPVMFIPAAVGLLNAWGILKPNWLIYTVVMFATTFIVMILSGHVTQAVIRHGKKKEGGDAPGGSSPEATEPASTEHVSEISVQEEPVPAEKGGDEA